MASRGMPPVHVKAQRLHKPVVEDAKKTNTNASLCLGGGGQRQKQHGATQQNIPQDVVEPPKKRQIHPLISKDRGEKDENVAQQAACRHRESNVRCALG